MRNWRGVVWPSPGSAGPIRPLLTRYQSRSSARLSMAGPSWQPLPKVCYYFNELFYPQMKIRRKWSEKEFLKRKKNQIPLVMSSFFLMTKTIQDHGPVALFFFLRWKGTQMGLFLRIPQHPRHHWGGALPCGRPMWRKSLAEKRKSNDQEQWVSPVTRPGT